MGFVPLHLYLVTGDERYKADYERECRFSIIGITVTGVVCLIVLIAMGIFCLVIT